MDRIIIWTVLFVSLLTVPYNVRAQAYSRAAYCEAAANAEEVAARFWTAWSQAGGTCGESAKACSERANKHRVLAEVMLLLVKSIRENTPVFNEPASGKTEQDEARNYRAIADEAEGNVAMFWDASDQARQNAELGRNVRTWTRAAEMAGRAAEAYEEAAAAAYKVAYAWERRTRDPGQLAE